MLLATNLLAQATRQAALAAVPWQQEARNLAGLLAGTLRNQSVDVIDIAVGTVHARAALVALQEGADAAFQAAMQIAESKAAEDFYSEAAIIDPMGNGQELAPEDGLERMRKRLARIPLEDGTVRLAAAGNHLVNAHLRLAWEANAATADEVCQCGFDPHIERSLRWAGMEQFRRGLAKLETQPLSVLPSFALTSDYRSYSGSDEVRRTWDFRDQIVHRDRPSYRDAPAFGRASLWTAEFKVTWPPPENEEDPDAPSIAERRRVASIAGERTLHYAQAIWELMQRWLRTVGVFIEHKPGEVRVKAQIWPGTRGPRVPHDQRDPGPFLRSP
ncbi:MAG: hypothetical protein ACREV8_01440 [Gammaproteobacteria bacterium]